MVVVPCLERVNVSNDLNVYHVNYCTVRPQVIEAYMRYDADLMIPFQNDL